MLFTVDADGGKSQLQAKTFQKVYSKAAEVTKERENSNSASRVSAKPDFTGDIYVMTLSGQQYNQSVSATIATVKAPIEVKNSCK